MAICSGDGYEEFHPIFKIPHNLKMLDEIVCKDFNADGILDLVYNIDVGRSGWNPTAYQLMIAYGFGDGTFQEPKLLKRFQRES